MKKKIRILLVLLLTVIVLRGPMYRLCVGYEVVGVRPSVELKDAKLIQRLEAEVDRGAGDMQDVISTARKMTNEYLHFVVRQNQSDPNTLIHRGEANCIGYSALFNSIAQYLISKYGLSGQYTSTHRIGKLYVLGFDIHVLFDDPFFKDHDFNQLENLLTGEIISIDPSVSDYLWINRVSIR